MPESPEAVMDFDSPAPVETPSPGLSFKDIVLQQQQRWEELKQQPFRDRSHAIDIPESVSENLLGLVIDHFPDYVPSEVREQIRATHPDPIVSTGILADKRIFQEEETDLFEFVTPPEARGEENRANWIAGIRLLTEIATDALAQDVITQLGEREKWFAPAAAILRKFNANGVNRQGLREIKKTFEDKDESKTFRQGLIVAMLTGETSQLNEQLDRSGYKNINQFAIELGEKTAADSDKHRMRKRGRIRASFQSLGFVSEQYPGVITMPLAHTLFSAANAASTAINIEVLSKIGTSRPLLAGAALLLTGGSSYFALRQPLSLPNALVHETCHYLGQDLNHFGLIQTKYAGPSTSVNPGANV